MTLGLKKCKCDFQALDGELEPLDGDLDPADGDFGPL